MEGYHYWLILGIILFIGEIFTPGFLLACLGIGAFVAGLAAFFQVSLTGQILWFSVATLIVFFGIRPFIMKFLNRFEDQTKIGIDALVGRDGIVTEKIIAEKQLGRVKIGGEDWKAKSSDGSDIEVQTAVIITGIEGATAYVERKNKGE